MQKFFRLPSPPCNTRRIALALLLLSLPCATSFNVKAQATQPTTAPASPLSAKAEKNFDKVANDALLAMRRRAGELNISGVALVAYFEGDTIQSWSSKMLVVGRMKDNPTDTNKGSNLLAIAYSKAAEMADTLKDSGSQVRPPMTGEVGWNGGVIARGKSGYLIAAFSGGKSEDDVKVSHAGIDTLKSKL